MSYEIVVSATNQTVTANTTELAVTVSAPATPTFTITNAVNSLTFATTLQTASIYTDAVELVLADLNEFWKGEWTAGNTYYRGDIVVYDYSQYFLKIWNPDINAGYNSNTLPPNDSNWQRFNWHTAPFTSLNVIGDATFTNAVYMSGPLVRMDAPLYTYNSVLHYNLLRTYGPAEFIGSATFTTATFNTATIALAQINTATINNLLMGSGAGNGLTVNTTATFNGITLFNGNTTFNGTTTAKLFVANTLTVNEAFIYNGLTYPKDKGLFGQVLFTNGSDKADWVNLGELVFWSLSNDLYTNGFDIYTNALNQNLRVGISNNNTFVSSPSYVEFLTTGYTGIYGGTSVVMRSPTARITVGSTATLNGDVYVIQNNGNTAVNGRLRAGTGIRFGDGTLQTTAFSPGTYGVSSITAGTGTFINQSTGDVVIWTSSTVAGVSAIIAGTGTFINTSTGVVTIWTTSTGGGGGGTTNIDFKAGNGLTVTTSTNGVVTTVTYTAKVATTTTLGGVIIGENLVVDVNGRISAVSTASSGNVDLTQDMNTNGFNIQHSVAYNGNRLTLSTNTNVLQLDSNKQLSMSNTDVRLGFDATTYLNLNSTRSILVNDDSYIAIDANDIEMFVDNSRKVWLEANRLRLAGGGGSDSLDVQTTSTRLAFGSNSVVLTAAGAALAANTATIGNDSNNSTLRVQRIYNYAGNYAPFFPAGVQYQDNTVQFTAYQPDQGLL